jgi:uncharacterized protein (TIGR00661 family)
MARFVFIVQGVGRGHLSQSVALGEYLEENNHTVEAVYAGCNEVHPLPGYFREHFEGRLHCFASPFFLRTPNKKGIYVGRTFLVHLWRIPLYLREISRLRREITGISPDAVINFYDPVGALAMRKMGPEVKRIGVGHHFFLHLQHYPCPAGKKLHRKLLGLLTGIIMKNCDHVLALSFRDVPGKGKIIVAPPLIRRKFREAVYTPGERGLVYLLNEGFITDLMSMVEEDEELQLDVFSELPVDTPMPQGIKLHALDAHAFLEKMKGCRFLITTSGFDTVAEAASMGVPLACIPVQNHFEQQCNGVDMMLSGLGIASDRIDASLISRMRKSPDQRYRLWVKRAEALFLAHVPG